ncbi:hypothetical protein JCGZ_06804 [Jatropha curcas]|uniref:Uncharacterized protein n=1 Tax=Jatropha curcas TaxID=180498 RepID=A0A067KYK8_JATCU|nr:hypothetical protein JCGZ_06804 [Jatropha curcas]
MAQFNSCKTVIIACIAAIFLANTNVSAQLAPAPSPDTGAGFSLPMSSAIVASSLVLSFIALLRH